MDKKRRKKKLDIDPEEYVLLHIFRKGLKNLVQQAMRQEIRQETHREELERELKANHKMSKQQRAEILAIWDQQMR